MEGSWKRPKHHLHVKLLLGVGATLDSWGMDGDVLKINMPTEVDVCRLVSASEKQYRTHLECAKHIPVVEEVSGPKKVELSRVPIELKNGTQWLHSRVEIDGYEEYSGIKCQYAGCSEEYDVIKWDLEHAGEDESLILEGNIGGGLVLQWQISIRKDNPKILQIDSGIIACSIGVGSGGFSRLDPETFLICDDVNGFSYHYEDPCS
ncbi:unnamed protein product [Dovyalis caffra]|uniref:Uncharacterized protein n=1 Tax=Dovyalis caffra TaxID=77055 RepID=A0AAV1R4T7_9ROSI|nr:unnamed protein product [Dovyalis caffra]